MYGKNNKFYFFGFKIDLTVYFTKSSLQNKPTVALTFF